MSVNSTLETNDLGSKELVSIRTLCGMLDMKERTIREKVTRREIPYYKVGKLIRFNVQEIRMWYGRSRVDSLTPDAITGRIL